MAWVAAAVQGVMNLMSTTEEIRALRSEADVAGYHAGIARQNAALKGQQTSAAEEALRREQRQFLGKQRASIAESGVGFGGSSADVMRQSTALAELDALNIQYEGNLERLNFLEEAKMHDWNKAAMRRKAKNLMVNRWFGATGSAVQAYGAAGGKFGSSAGGMGGMKSIGTSSSGIKGGG